MATFKWRGVGAAGTGAWETTSDWLPVGEPGANDVADIVRGVATEDVNQPDGAAGVQVGAVAVLAGAGLVIGDSAGTHRAILTLGNVQNSSIAGAVTVYGAGAEQSQLFAGGGSAKLEITSGGTLNLDGGSLIAVSALTVTGAGTINLDGGYIGGSSAQAVDRLIVDTTIVGIGGLDAANYYGGSNYNGLITYNHGVIDAANSDDSTAGLSIAGGVLDNYGSLEAANPSGAIGSSGLYIDFGAIVQNFSSGSISSGTDGFIDLDSGEIIDGDISGLFYVDGSGNTLNVTNGGALHIDAATYVSGALAIAGAGAINDAYMQVDGSVVIKDTFSNNINGVIDVFGTFTTSAFGGVGNSGEIIADEGTVTFNSSYIEGAGQTLIENGGTMVFNKSTSNVITFDGYDAGTLVLDHGATVGSVKDFNGGNGSPTFQDDVINFRDVGYSSGETATLTQSGDTAIVQVGAYTVLLDGVYTSSTSPGILSTVNTGNGFLGLAKGPQNSTSLVDFS